MFGDRILVGGEEVTLDCKGAAADVDPTTGGALGEDEIVRLGPASKLWKLTCPVLKGHLKARKMRVGGKKEELIRRLLECAPSPSIERALGLVDAPSVALRCATAEPASVFTLARTASLAQI